MRSVSVLPAELDGHIETALPWYVNGTLPEAQRAEVELHLSVCALCRASHHLEVLLQQQLNASDDALECTPEAAAIATTTLLGRATPARRRRVRRRFVPILLLAQASAIALLAFALVHVVDDRNSAPYRTLTDPPVQADPANPTLRVVFAEDATSATIRRLLSEIHGTISAGPGTSNVYTVELGRVAGTSDRRSIEAARWLRSQAGVLLAEPVNPPAPD